MGGQDALKSLDSKIKAALTREYNKVAHMSQGINQTMYKVKRGRQKAPVEEEEAALEGKKNFKYTIQFHDMSTRGNYYYC